MKDTSLIFLFSPSNKYSINALLGSLETKNYFSKLDIFLCGHEKIKDEISHIHKKYKKVAIACSFFSTQVDTVVENTTYIKRNFPDIILIAGGPHASGAPRSCINFDIVVRGEGEETILDISDWLLEIKSLSQIKGIYLTQGEEIKFTGKREFIDLDKFLPFSYTKKKLGPIEITRGCPYGCFYCQTSYIFGKKPRHRSIDTVLSLVENLFKRGIRDIRFITPNGFSYGSEDGKYINYKKLEELLKGIRGIIKGEGRIFFGSFPSEVRPEHVNEYTVGLIKKYANNDNLVIGCQSGSERMLEMCRRGHGVSEVIRAAKVCIKNGLIPKIDFIFGLPGETQKDIDDSIKLMKELTKIGAKIHAHTFMPFPGTPFKNKRPGDIRKYYSFLKYGLPKGLVFGEFEKQREIAKRLSHIMEQKNENGKLSK